MEAHIKSQFGPQILDEALSRYGIDGSTARELDGFESFVYEATRAGKECILRISHSRHRSAEQIAGEIDWISYLTTNGVSACPALPSLSGELLETLGGAHDYFIATVFSKAPGQPADAAEWQPLLFERMGRMMGRMHALTKQYAPANPSFTRPQWHDDITGIAEKFLPADQSMIIDKFNAMLTATHALPKGEDSYGLIHFDFHRGNFFVDAGQIHLFDFDDCQYSWFADDIAIALFYAVPHDCSAPEDLAFARTFMRDFLAGYYTQNELESEWLARIPLFLKRREIDLYTIIHRSMDLNQLDPWPASFMDRRASKIENDVPFIDIDFLAL